MHTTTLYPRRGAFTLIEMLVVIALILILMTIAAAMFPRFAENQRITKAGDQIQGWMLIAKQRALYDRRATGIRLILDPADPQQLTVRELVYVQQPDDFSVGRCSGTRVPGLVTFTGDITGGQGVGPLSAVQPGDHLEVNGGGLVSLIDRVIDQNTVGLLAGRTVPLGSYPYRIIRTPRAVVGEQPLQLPANIVIDIAPNRSQSLPPVRTIATNPPQRYAEIVFAPGGGVTGQGTSTGGNIILWLRDVTKDNNSNPLEGSPLLVSIHTRTGMVAVHPVNTADPANYYLFTRDGRSSGL